MKGCALTLSQLPGFLDLLKPRADEVCSWSISVFICKMGCWIVLSQMGHRKSIRGDCGFGDQNREAEEEVLW